MTYFSKDIVHAAYKGCTVIYGGGQNHCIDLVSQIPPSTTGGNQNPGIIKGGFPVYPAPVMNQTPATGPEMLPLLGMIPTALAGFALRRKSK